MLLWCVEKLYFSLVTFLICLDGIRRFFSHLYYKVIILCQEPLFRHFCLNWQQTLQAPVFSAFFPQLKGSFPNQDLSQPSGMSPIIFTLPVSPSTFLSLASLFLQIN